MIGEIKLYRHVVDEEGPLTFDEIILNLWAGHRRIRLTQHVMREKDAERWDNMFTLPIERYWLARIRRYDIDNLPNFEYLGSTSSIGCYIYCETEEDVKAWSVFIRHLKKTKPGKWDRRPIYKLHNR